ncbi:long-chain fatty acid--CoA ligase [Salicibibacter cibarius]|uniref:Long-chain fatty acid--CoA ligase n=1 Tax=Salicibibacter cibarius TaxID=2743000 RepID=A0A7T7CC42_9BACI|nr:long-chain fatty acid--CoA ligase [Salicibibacter cibarius]QQK76548.1 long-chain fatty acid--CoA ligase [Salicibibacter cibarius]
MNTKHYPSWPGRLPKTLTVPGTTVYDNILVSAKRYPDKVAVHYYGASYTYADLFLEVEGLAGFLEHSFNVRKGDRVMLYMQNAPQYVISMFAILRLGAVVVPINPMNKEAELEFCINDCGIKAGIVGQEIYENVQGLKASTTLESILVAAYSDYLPDQQPFTNLPDEVVAPVKQHSDVRWGDALAEGRVPSEYTGSQEDVAFLPYTSGTTGMPKGCVHTHYSYQANTFSAAHWSGVANSTVHLAALPFFHVTGVIHSLIMPLTIGASIVIMTRWNREHAAEMIERYACTNWVNISTMVVDFLANPRIQDYDISSLTSISGGGAALPEAVGEQLHEWLGLRYVEGYGLTETISHTHFNPPDAPKLQCLGIPAFDVDSRVIDPVTLQEVEVGEVGEIIVNGPQVFEGYYNRPEETAESFIEIEGKRFFRTGDMGRIDEDGYFFMVDRIKRMINASGFNVWPSEVESYLFNHPDIQQACVVGVPDPVRGESVKAFAVLHPESEGKVREEDIIDWAKEQMAAYKYPRSVEFRTSLPTTASGKILWRQLQNEEAERSKS